MMLAGLSTASFSSMTARAILVNSTNGAPAPPQLSDREASASPSQAVTILMYTFNNSNLSWSR
jgi:hypothetical protein